MSEFNKRVKKIGELDLSQTDEDKMHRLLFSLQSSRDYGNGSKDEIIIGLIWRKYLFERYEKYRSIERVDQSQYDPRRITEAAVMSDDLPYDGDYYFDELWYVNNFDEPNENHWFYKSYSKRTERQRRYRQMLKHPEWQRKRLEIMQRDDFKCQHCGSDDIELQVHHIKYRGKYPWDTDSQHLVTLCGVCHQKVHQEERELKKKRTKKLSSIMGKNNAC